MGEAVMGYAASPGRTMMRSTPGKRPSYAGPTACLRCERMFESWDRRQHRLCPSCRDYLQAEPSDEPSYRLPKARDVPREE
jgi:hypothetical protein